METERFFEDVSYAELLRAVGEIGASLHISSPELFRLADKVEGSRGGHEREEHDDVRSLYARVEANLAHRYLCEQVARGTSPRGQGRVASGQQHRLVVSFLEAMPHQAGLGTLIQKARDLWALVRSAPRLWEALKKSLGAESLEELPAILKEWAAKGMAVLRRGVDKLSKSFPAALYLVPKDKMPSISDLLQRILGSSPKVEAAFRTLNTKVVAPLDTWMAKAIPNLSRPLKAAVFIWIWLNVAEVSWDFKSIMEGFTGAMSLGDILSSLPESGVGAILAAFGVGYHLLPVAVVARILWLVASKFVSWKDGKLVVHWSRISGEKKADEALAVL